MIRLTTGCSGLSAARPAADSERCSARQAGFRTEMSAASPTATPPYSKPDKKRAFRRRFRAETPPAMGLPRPPSQPLCSHSDSQLADASRAATTNSAIRSFTSSDKPAQDSTSSINRRSLRRASESASCCSPINEFSGKLEVLFNPLWGHSETPHLIGGCGVFFGGIACLGFPSALMQFVVATKRSFTFAESIAPFDGLPKWLGT